METSSILIIALIVSNASWMLYSFWTHAQHMRAYHWMIGFRPHVTSSSSPPVIHTSGYMRPASVEGFGPEYGNTSSVRGIAPVTSNGGLTKQSPMTGMGELEP